MLWLKQAFTYNNTSLGDQSLAEACAALEKEHGKNVR